MAPRSSACTSTSRKLNSPTPSPAHLGVRRLAAALVDARLASRALRPNMPRSQPGDAPWGALRPACRRQGPLFSLAARLPPARNNTSPATNLGVRRLAAALVDARLASRALRSNLPRCQPGDARSGGPAAAGPAPIPRIPPEHYGASRFCCYNGLRNVPPGGSSLLAA